MKSDGDAADQYEELAAALRELQAGWIVDEVDEVVARGRTVPFRELSRDEQSGYRERLAEQARKGVRVGAATAGDEIGVPFSPYERLALLVDATQRVVVTSARSHAYVVAFARQHNLQAVGMAPPAGVDPSAASGVRNEVVMSAPDDIDARVARLERVLRDQVLD